MTTFQKIIKYGAIAFGVYLCVIIISAIIFTLTTIFGITIGISQLGENWNRRDNSTNSSSNEIIESQSYEYTDIKKLDIELSLCKFNIVVDNTLTNNLKVEIRNDSNKIYSKQSGSELRIEDDTLTSMDFFKSKNIVPEVIISIPNNYEFEIADIKVNINESNVEKLYGKNVKIETGGGRVIVKEVVANELNIEGGAGEIIVENSKAERLDFEAGVGNAEITTEVTNRADINSAVGRLELNLLGNKENYMIIPSVGIGAVTVDNEKAVSKNVIGSGNQRISIDAGVGEVVVNFIENV